MGTMRFMNAPFKILSGFYTLCVLGNSQSRFTPLCAMPGARFWAPNLGEMRGPAVARPNNTPACGGAERYYAFAAQKVSKHRRARGL